jgi:hypothetical protein
MGGKNKAHVGPKVKGKKNEEPPKKVESVVEDIEEEV